MLDMILSPRDCNNSFIYSRDKFCVVNTANDLLTELIFSKEFSRLVEHVFNHLL